MLNIITTTQLQQKIGKISDLIGKQSFIVTNRGEAKVVLLPYFDGCDEFIEDYMEDFEINKNHDKLKKEMQDSLGSGTSDLEI